MNRLRLRATLIGRSALRFTPAGTPIVQAQLRHASGVMEAGIERQIAFECDAIAAGAVAEKLDRQKLGSEIELDGFLATTSRRSQRLRIHITEFMQIREDSGV